MTQPEEVPDDITALREEYIRTEIEPIFIRNNITRREPIVITVVRDEVSLMPDFMRHYRKAGIRRFAIVDNNSCDGTFEFLCRQPDVDLYSAKASFTTVRKQAWLSMILDLYNINEQWFLHADADEHIVFDGLSAGQTFTDLTAAMERKNVRRVRGCLIDMYSANSIDGREFDRREWLSEVYPFFDAFGYREYNLPQLVAREGGPRQRLFGNQSGNFRPQLTKYPLFRHLPGDVFVNPHFSWPYQENFRSACLLGILHFKFLPNFTSKVKRALTEGNYWGNSIEYRYYNAVLEQKKQVSPVGESTELYTGPDSLMRCGLISPVPW